MKPQNNPLETDAGTVELDPLTLPINVPALLLPGHSVALGGERNLRLATVSHPTASRTSAWPRRRLRQ